MILRLSMGRGQARSSNDPVIDPPRHHPGWMARRCPECDVHWYGEADCWMCGQPIGVSR